MPKIRQSVNKINYTQGLVLDRVFAPAASGPVNLVLNPSFTDDSTVGWESSINYMRDTTDYRTAPAAIKSASYYDDAPRLEYQKLNVLTPNQRYSLSFWFKGGYPYEPINYYVTTTFGGTYQPLILGPYAPNVWHNVKVENILCGAGTGFSFSLSAQSSDYDLRIDDVSVVQGPTALVL